METEENTGDCKSRAEEEKRENKKKCLLNLPAIREERAFKNEIYRAWKQVRMPAGNAGHTE